MLRSDTAQTSQCCDPVPFRGERRIGGQASLHLDGVTPAACGVSHACHILVRDHILKSCRPQA